MDVDGRYIRIFLLSATGRRVFRVGNEPIWTRGAVLEAESEGHGEVAGLELVDENVPGSHLEGLCLLL